MVTTQPLPRGVLTAMVTPVDERGRIDEAGIDRLVDRAVAGGVRGLSPCGSTGEGARLTPEQRLQVTGRVRARAVPGIAVVPGVPVASVASARDELVELGRLGVTAALVAPPSYYPADDSDLLRLYSALADESAVPLVLYNIPVFTGVPLPVGVVTRLAAHPRIIGMKDSSRDVEYLQSVVLAVSDAGYGERFRVYTGADTLLLASLLIGADGAVAASSNLVPELGVGVFDAAGDGDLGAAMRLQRQLVQIVTACRRGALPAGWKAALQLAGVCGADLLPPAAALAEPLRQELMLQLRRAEVVPLGVSFPAELGEPMHG